MNLLVRSIIGMLIAVSLMVFSAAGGGSVEQQEGINAMNMEGIMQKIAADIPGDRMSPCWDGRNLTIVQDQLDREDILDGRGGEYRYTRLKAAIGTLYSVDREELLAEKQRLENTETCFEAMSANRYLRVAVEEQAYEAALVLHQERLEAGEALAVSCGWQPKGVCEAALITVPDGRMMLGLRFIVPSDARTKIIEYAGLGMYPDIKAEAEMAAQKIIR